MSNKFTPNCDARIARFVEAEYFGHRPQDGSGDVFFHLDPLWADANIDVVGVDWYPSLTDWRDGLTHLDAALARTDHDPGYLESRIEAGEGHDYYYATLEDRADQTRTPITDGSHGEPWIYRAKDVRNFWGRAHYNRPGGVRSGTPTAWVPESKQIWLTELGCPAIDKGANAPNLFIDAKSNESAAPPFFSGVRDDLIQRRTLEAYLRYWDGPANPASSVTAEAMIGEVFLWCWDARPHPAFPARSDVWSDGVSWRRGHWLNGRAGMSELGETVAAICARAAEAPVEARVRFLDAARDHLIATVSARRLDRAEGGVETLDAPLVMEADAAERVAQRLLADRRAAAESIAAAVGPANLAFEPGDLLSFEDGDGFEIVRVEDAETRRLSLRRARTPSAGAFGLAEPTAPPSPAHAPSPAFNVLDLPPLPGAEDDVRPLAAVFAAPWLSAHQIYAGVDADALTRRGQASRPALMGELLWALWPGPVDRWDQGNVIRIKLYGGVLASVSSDAVLNGSNAFAVEGAEGEWELVQACTCTLVAPGEYELSGPCAANSDPPMPCARRTRLAHGSSSSTIVLAEWTLAPTNGVRR